MIDYTMSSGEELKALAMVKKDCSRLVPLILSSFANTHTAVFLFLCSFGASERPSRLDSFLFVDD